MGKPPVSYFLGPCRSRLVLRSDSRESRFQTAAYDIRPEHGHEYTFSDVGEDLADHHAPVESG